MKLKMHMREVIENTIKSGNGYLELEWRDEVVEKVFPVFDSSRFYINCDVYGKPLPLQNGEFNTDEYYLQRVDPNYRAKGVKDFPDLWIVIKSLAKSRNL